jgi:hypothetical protein
VAARPDMVDAKPETLGDTLGMLAGGM